MKKLLILVLLIKSINAGSLLSKCFKQQVELANLGQTEDATNNNQVEKTVTNNNLDANNQEQNVLERNRLLAKYLFYRLSKKEIIEQGLLEQLKMKKKLNISQKEATERLKELNWQVDVAISWREFRQEIATLINSGGDVNFDSGKFYTLLNHAVLYQDYFLVYFLLKRGAISNRETLSRAKTRVMTELLVLHGALPLIAEWDPWEDPIDFAIRNGDSGLLSYYVDKYNFLLNKIYEDGDSILHLILCHGAVDLKKKIMILLVAGADPYQRDNDDKSAVDIAINWQSAIYSHNKKKFKKRSRAFLEVLHKYNAEYNQTFKETLIEQTKEILPLELQDYIYKFHAGENAELFRSEN